MQVAIGRFFSQFNLRSGFACVHGFPSPHLSAMADLFPTRTIAIIGGGVSGSLVATNLLRLATEPLRIVVIERQLPVGRGVAYRTNFREHLLNVPAGRMGIWPDDPGHFVRWLREHRGEAGIPDQVEPGAFLPRCLFGTYVQRILQETRAAAIPEVTYEEIEGEAIDLSESGCNAVITLANGNTLLADRVILALGNLPGEYPIPRPLSIYHTSRYVHVPWLPGTLDGIGPDDDVLLVGQGLTATDLIVQIARHGHRGTLHALSRHGIRPRVHRPYSPFPAFLELEPIPSTVRELVRRVRREAREAIAKGSDWRAVVDGLRPYTQQIWEAWSASERARFMRHVRPLWEVHRHRIAPEVAAVLERLQREGRLIYHAGRLQTLDAEQDGVHALVRFRGTIKHLALRVAKVINCTGPRTDYSKYQHPLFVHLLARGLIDHDALALGINALPTGEVLRYRGGAVGWLYTLGAPLKGILWETTAVAEIRVQARNLAERVLAESAVSVGAGA